MAVKQPNSQERQEMVDMIADKQSEITLQSGRKIKISYIIGETQDKLNQIIADYETKRKAIIGGSEDGKVDETTQFILNQLQRKLFAQSAAAIILNTYWGIRLKWRFFWRYIYRHWNLSGQDYLNIILECKKKAQEQEYMMAMQLLMDTTTIWTTMSKKEAEEYRQELQLAREAASLKNSQA